MTVLIACIRSINVVGLSIYYVHRSNPAGLLTYKSMKLSTQTTAHAKFRHIKHYFLGSPYTACKSNKGNLTKRILSDESGYQNYTEYGCLEFLLMAKLCSECECYPTYIQSLSKSAEFFNTLMDGFGKTCRNRFNLKNNPFSITVI